jgi:hypothetical protein
MVQYLIAAPIVLAVVALIAAALTGRAKVGSCCAPPDPARDLRMRGAFDLEESTAWPSRAGNERRNRRSS